MEHLNHHPDFLFFRCCGPRLSVYIDLEFTIKIMKCFQHLAGQLVMRIGPSQNTRQNGTTQKNSDRYPYPSWIRALYRMMQGRTLFSLHGHCGLPSELFSVSVD